MTDPTAKRMAKEELTRLKKVFESHVEGGGDELQGAMLVVATNRGVQTFPYVDAEEDPREMSLWMLAAMMAHIADSATQASGSAIYPLEAAKHADALMKDSVPDERGGDVYQGK